MPYIAKEDREALDKAIEELADRIVERAQAADSETAFAGILNYSISDLASTVLRKQFGKIRYWQIAALTGVLNNVKDEFYRRVSAPYEDAQIKKSGDIEPYAEYTAELKE